MSHVNYNYHHTTTGRKGRRSASLTLLSALPILLFVFAGLTSIGNALTIQAALDLVKSALTILLSVVIIFVSIGCVSEMCGHRNETDGAFDSKHRCEPSALADRTDNTRVAARRRVAVLLDQLFDAGFTRAEAAEAQKRSSTLSGCTAWLNSADALEGRLRRIKSDAAKVLPVARTATGRKGRRSASLTLLSALPILLFVFAGLTSIGNALTIQAALDLVKSALTILLTVMMIFFSIGCVSESAWLTAVLRIEGTIRLVAVLLDQLFDAGFTRAEAAEAQKRSSTLSGCTAWLNSADALEGRLRRIKSDAAKVLPVAQKAGTMVDDALQYLDRVKCKFAETPRIYNELLGIMRQFKSRTIDTPGVIAHVARLFQGSPDLILGFNAFLPTGYKIECVSDDGSVRYGQGLMTPQLTQLGSVMRAEVQHQHQPPPPAFDHAISYVTKIRSRFRDDDDHANGTYKTFLEILHTYQQGVNTSKTSVLDKVTTLFKDHPDLLREFTYFLPEKHARRSEMEETEWRSVFIQRRIKDYATMKNDCLKQQRQFAEVRDTVQQGLRELTDVMQRSDDATVQLECIQEKLNMEQPRLPPQVARELRAARRQSVTLRRNVERSYRKDLFMTNVRRDQAAVAVFATYALRKLNYDASVCFNRRCEAQTRSAFVNVSGKGGDKWCCERCPRGVWITPPLPAVALPSEPDIWFGDEGPLCPACTAKVDLAAAEEGQIRFAEEQIGMLVKHHEESQRQKTICETELLTLQQHAIRMRSGMKQHEIALRPTLEKPSSGPPVFRQLKVEDALAYLDKVKAVFDHKKETYSKFLDIMRMFKEQQINTRAVINEVCNLFEGYDQLLLDFNTFLPIGYKIALSKDQKIVILLD